MKSISSNSMKSAETSLSAAMDVSFFETYGMKVPDNQQTCSNLSAVDLSNANKGYANVMQDADSPVPKSSESDEDFQDSWDEEGNSSPAYDC
jgi:FMN-dependent NADH-azoreductase